jgi:PTS system nitrogen regulatory IIA component
MNISVKDAARLLTVSEKTIYRWIKQDIIPAYKINEFYRFSRPELLEWATSRRMGVAVDAFNEPESGLLPSLSEALESGGVFYRIEGRNRDEIMADVVTHLRLPDEIDRVSLPKLLIARENLASTAVGHGIAIPHLPSTNLVHLTRPTVTLFFLENPVDFSALDGQPVNILLTLLSPSLRLHLHLLSLLGFVLQDASFLKILQNQSSREKIFTALTAAESRIKVN